MNFFVFGISIATLLFFAGCGIEETAERVMPEPKPAKSELPQAYNRIHLKQSSSADVLEIIKLYEPELISQSESIVASWGEKKKGYEFWLTMVGFDEEEFTVTRKYFLAFDEKPWFIGAKGEKLRFDSQMAIDEETLSEAYTSENQKRIAIMETILEKWRDDIAEVREDSKVIDNGGMIVNQTMERILYILKQSPGLAERLNKPTGLDFDHLTMGKSRVQMVIDDKEKTVKIKIRIGNLNKIWDEE